MDPKLTLSDYQVVSLGISTIPFRSGCVYHGEMVNKTPEGFCIAIHKVDLRIACLYIGHFSKGQFAQNGLEVLPTEVYHGGYADNLRDGSGLLRTSDGKSYQVTYVKGNLQSQKLIREKPAKNPSPSSPVLNWEVSYLEQKLAIRTSFLLETSLGIKPVFEGLNTETVFTTTAPLVPSEGSEFHGELDPSTKKAHGFGVLLTHKYVYAGNFAQGFLTGLGAQFERETRKSYMGDFVHGELHGRGTYVRNEGYYFGQFLYDHWKDPQGFWITKEGHLFKNYDWSKRTAIALKGYSGMVEADKPHGLGFLAYKNGAYSGHFASGVRKGWGIMYYSLPEEKKTDQCYLIKYEGMWANDTKHGEGIATFENGWTYTGHFKEGNFHGFGTMLYPQTEPLKKYTGRWEKGLFHGKGTLEMRNGRTFTGCFEKGIMKGKGVVDYPEPLEKEPGRFYYKRYDGLWKDNLFHGQGTLTFYDGPTWIGRFQEGTFMPDSDLPDPLKAPRPST